MSRFIPRVVILGDKNDLPNDLLNNLPNDFPQFEIVGQAVVEAYIDRARKTYVFEVFINGNRVEDLSLPDFDYVLCTSWELCSKNKFWFYLLNLPTGMLVTTNFFREHVSSTGFICVNNTRSIIESLTRIDGRILDLDGYFARAEVMDLQSVFYEDIPNINQNSKIEGVIQNCEPIFRNLYSEIFSDFEEIKLRHYDLIVLTAERSIEEWLEILNWAVEFSTEILAFIHCESPALKDLKQISVERAEVFWSRAIRGEFLHIKPRIDGTCKIYMATHKRFYIPTLPKNYHLIHAGKKIFREDLGFPGDDSGDSVSELNVQINELSALYWLWKNSSRVDYIGFSNYRRFFVLPGANGIQIGTDGEHIAESFELIDLLRDYDIIVGIPAMNYISFDKDFRAHDESDRGEQIFRRYFSERQPDYLETLNKIEAGDFLISNTMFFTRWSLFEKYCEWLFSFLIPAAREYATDDRTMSYKGERAFMVWLTQNNLKIKFIPILRNNIREATAENFSFQHFERIKLII